MDDPSQRSYVLRQHSDDERVNLWVVTHRAYSESKIVFADRIFSHLDVQPEDRALDVGSGLGQYHRLLSSARVVVVHVSVG